MYDFTNGLERRHTNARKWELLKADDAPQGTVPFSVADMEFKTPPEVVEGICDYVRRESLGYNTGDDDFYEAVAAWLESQNGYSVSRQWMIPVAGVVKGFMEAIDALSKEGDGVIIFSPVYPPFAKTIEALHRKVVSIPLLEEGLTYRLDMEAFRREARKSENTMLLFCSPHNPVGRVWTKEELEEVAEVVCQSDLVMISDEIWKDLTMPGYTHHMMACISPRLSKERLVTCVSPSKTFNIAGLQTSLLIVENDRLRERIEMLAQSHHALGCNVVGMAAATAAYRKGLPWYHALLSVLAENRDRMYRFVKERMPGISCSFAEGTFVVWMDCRALGMDPLALEAFCAKHFIYVSHGYLFGKEGEGFIRWNIAAPWSDLEKALLRFEEAVRPFLEIV